MTGDAGDDLLLWLIALILSGIFYVAVLPAADRTGKIVKLLGEIRDALRARCSSGNTTTTLYVWR